MTTEAGVVAQHVKPPPALPAAPHQRAGLSSCCWTSDPAPCTHTWESRRWPKYPQGSPQMKSAWHQDGPAVAVAASWGAKQWMENLSPPFKANPYPLPLYYLKCLIEMPSKQLSHCLRNNKNFPSFVHFKTQCFQSEDEWGTRVRHLPQNIPRKRHLF